MEFHTNDFFWRHVFSEEYQKHHGVTIEHTDALGGRVFIRGVHLSDTNLGFQAAYGNNSKVNNLASNALGAAADRVNGVVKDVASTASETVTGTSTTMNDTVKTFAGVPNPSFDLELLLIKGAQNHTEYLQAINDSLRLVLPPDDLQDIAEGTLRNILPEGGTRFISSFIPDTLITPPLGIKPDWKIYDPRSRFTRQHGLVIAIGQQLLITHMLCEDFSFTESPQKRSDGHPLYIKCRYRFVAGRALTISEVKSWFIGLKDYGTL